MASRNPLERRILRRCPGIVDGGGRELEAVLDPEDGGTLRLRWTGDKSGDVETYRLSDLAPGAASPARSDEDPGGPPGPLSQWISFRAFLDFLHVAPASDYKEKLAMVSLVRVLSDFARFRAWIGSRTSSSWEEWKARYPDEALAASAPDREWPEGEEDSQRNPKA